MESRNFKLDTEWNMIHYSEKPNGFGILLIGDERHFVDENKSFWTQNEGKQSLLKHLQESGYLIFYSNLYGKHWGASKASTLAARLYHHVMRTEILNQRIHILAEGMGVLVALELIKSLEDKIRSVVFLNPVFSLQHQLDQEKEHKFFYKKLLKEISQSYNWDLGSVEENVNLIGDNVPSFKTPTKIINVLSGRRAYLQSDYSKALILKWGNDSIQSSFIVPEKKQQIGRIITQFYTGLEKEL